ncbi:MAG: FeoA family protein [Gemmatimonadota bacterium]|nr:FeoA family protein [Gemmatimonadota bacterium]MDQ8146625.1 FeoA family protein [Gemmatimonadota bacterium]MDQ8148955.1 FeoA family protein [Gemmatimonadota bacterium]MDQ8156031.1 FeoA family protein [Gemmatimonadota bacterium]MDQ8175979.1 FeoA family protein [Gemmatimonadota bacterium]
MTTGSARELPVCTCPLVDSATGAEATVVAIACADRDACRLRAMGVYEGATVSVIDKKHCLLVDVRGTRLALGAELAEGITVLTRGIPAT